MKRKITIDRPTIDSTEIASRQNFSNIINQIPATPSIPFYKSGWFFTTLACVAGLTVVTLFLTKENSSPESNTLLTEAPPHADSASPVITSNLIYSEDSPCVKPPKKELDIPMTIYKVNGLKGANLEHITGTKITIPSNAFVDENNQPIIEEVTIHFREINHPIDIMLSGIPMKYDTANQNKILLSDGMIEIEGYLNGEKVKIAPNKTIEIALKASSDETKFNSYQLDKNSTNWNYTGKPTYENEKTVVNHTVKQPDKSLAEEIKQIEKESNIAKHQYETSQKAVTDWKKNEPEKPITGGNKERQFVLDVSPKEFPELASYKNLIFEVEQNDPNFSASVYSEEWSDVSLSEKEKGKKYYLTLFKSGAKKTFSVFPVFSGDDLKLAMADFNKSFSTYSKELEIRKEKEAVYKTQFEGKLEQWQKAKEKEIAALEIKQNQDENANKVKMIARVLNVTTFGIWNIDCGISPPTGIAQKVIFKDQYGNEVDIVHANLFEKGKKTIYTYSKQDFNNFEYNPDEENTIIAFLGTDKVGIVLNDQFEQNKKLKTTTFILDIQPLTDELIATLKSKTM